METDDKNEPPSLPPNYLSLADLQQRWIKQQQNKTESQKLIQEPIPGKEEEICESQKPKLLPPRGKIGAKDVKQRRGKQNRGGKDENPESQLMNESESQIAEVCETQKPNLVPPQGKVAVKDVRKRRGKQQHGPHRERNFAPGDVIGGKDENPESQLMNESESRKPIQEQIAEKEKKVCETQKPNVFPSQGRVRGKDVKQRCGPQLERNFAPGDQIGGKDENPESQLPKLVSNPNLSNGRKFGVYHGRRKGVMEYRLAKSNQEPKPLKIEAEVTVVEAKIEGGEKSRVKQKKTKKYKKKKAEKEGEDDKVKGGGESTVKMGVGDRTVEMEEKLKGLPVMEMEEKVKKLPVAVPVPVWGRRRDWGRSRDVIEGGRRGYHGYGRDEHRGVWKGRREEGLKWVKKGEIVDNSN